MKTLKSFSLFFALFLVCSASAYAKNGQGAGNHYIFRLFGTGTGYAASVPDGEGGTIEATCFDIQLMDLANRRVVGTASDCLSDIVAINGQINLKGTTFFHLSQGTLVTQGLTSVRSARPGTATEVGSITHITGAANAAINSIVFGTKRFADVTGTARLSGMVNLSKLDSDGMITFDCIFIVNLD